MTARSHLFIASILLVLAAPTLASAQMFTGELPGRDAGDTQSRIAGEMGLYVYDQGPTEAALAQPSFYASFGLLDSRSGGFLDLDLAWRAAGSAGDISAFRAGNPYVGIRGGFRDRRDRWRFRVGAGATAPLMSLYDDYRAPGDIEAVFTVTVANAMQGNLDAWLLAPLTASLVVRADFEYRGDAWGIGVDSAFAAMLPVEYNDRTGDTTYAAQLGVFALGRPVDALAIGGRFQAVMLDSSRDGTSPEGYLALIPFIRGEFGGGFIEGRLVMNLDEPLGFAFDDGNVWAVYVSGGANF